MSNVERLIWVNYELSNADGKTKALVAVSIVAALAAYFTVARGWM
jgi:hypothetical protein